MSMRSFGRGFAVRGVRCEKDEQVRRGYCIPSRQAVVWRVRPCQASLTSLRHGDAPDHRHRVVCTTSTILYRAEAGPDWAAEWTVRCYTVRYGAITGPSAEVAMKWSACISFTMMLDYPIWLKAAETYMYME